MALSWRVWGPTSSRVACYPRPWAWACWWRGSAPSPDRRSARYFLAGHPEPLMMVGRQIVDLPPSKIGVPLGVLPDYAWTGVDVPLPSGWSLACYTDGLIEGRVPDDVDRLGVERLCEILAKRLRDGPDWMDLVIAEVTELNGGALEYEKLRPRSTRPGSRATPETFRTCVKSLGTGPVFCSQLSRLNPLPALVPAFLDNAYEPRICHPLENRFSARSSSPL